jgi:hypothetical protein
MGHGRTRGLTDDLEHDLLLPVLGQEPLSVAEDILQAIDSGFDFPLRLYANPMAPDSQIKIGPSQIQAPNGSGKSTSPIGVTIPASPVSTIDFQSQVTTGATVTIVFPASTVGRFRRLALTLMGDGSISAEFSGEQVSLGSLASAAALFDATGTAIGWVDLECTDSSGLFKTAGSATLVVENAVGGVSRIVNLQGGSGAGGGATNAGRAQNVPIPLDATSIVVVFTTPLPGPNYVVSTQLENLTDDSPQFQTCVVTNKTANGFTATWNAGVDSVNYTISYIAPALQEQTGEVPVSGGATDITIPLPFGLAGVMYVVTAQLVNLVDGSPQFQPVTITAKTNLNFTADWNAPTDGSDYRLAFQVAQFS